MKKVLLVASMLLAANVSAQSFMKQDQTRPVDMIARDLGVTSEQFVKCFDGVEPAPKGNQPSVDKQRSNKKILLPCLQKINKNITNKKLDAVMDKYRK